MGIREAFKNAAVAAYKVISDLLEPVTFKYIEANSTYSITTGIVTDRVSEYSVDMLISQWSANEVDGKTILAFDMKAEIPVENLVPTPNLKCKVTRSDGIDYDIKKIGTDPAGAIWTFNLRAT